MANLKVESVVSAEIRVSNNDDSLRDFDISGVVRVMNGAAGEIYEGTLKEKGAIMNIATFSSYSGNHLNIDIQQSDYSNVTIVENVDDFINKIRTDKNIIAECSAEK